MSDAPPTVLIIGAGAAGMAAAIFAAEAARTSVRIVVVDGARKPGAKILVSGGGRCNVTHQRITPQDYNGGSSNTIRNVLRSFDESRTLRWMGALGVELKLEPTGKYFPASDSARTVLDALLRRMKELAVGLRAPWRVEQLRRTDAGFLATSAEGDEISASRVIVATGGLALPKSGSDGAGLRWMEALGHRMVPTTPALAPLVLRAGAGPGGRFAELAGLTTDARLVLEDERGRRVAAVEGSLVYTHMGISGPAPMNLSRHIARRRLDEPGKPLRVTMGRIDFPTLDAAEQWLMAQAKEHPKRMASSAMGAVMPDRLATVLADGLDHRLAELPREARRELARRMAALPIDVAGDRGYTFAETTAGGVDLAEVDPRTMESRRVPGLHLCGEILDVDGRIGGFNFQWAWASGYLAGRGAVAAMAVTHE